MSGGTSSPAPRPTVNYDGAIFEASRPEVLPYLVNVMADCAYGWFVEFHGTAAELVAAGLATADLFEIGKSGQRTHRCEFGDQYIVKRERGKWTLSIRTEEEMQWPSDSTLDPNCQGYIKKGDRKRWLAQGGAEAEAATAAILARVGRRGSIMQDRSVNASIARFAWAASTESALMNLTEELHEQYKAAEKLWNGYKDNVDSLQAAARRTTDAVHRMTEAYSDVIAKLNSPEMAQAVANAERLAAALSALAQL